MLSKPCSSLKGVGPVVSEQLNKCGIITLSDLLFHLPYRYQDRTRITAISDLRLQDWAVVLGRVCHVEIKKGKRPTLHCLIEDKTGCMQLRFFYFNKHQINALKNNTMVRAFGEVRAFNSMLHMVHPEYQLVQDDADFCVEETLTPIYPSTQGLTQSKIRQLVNMTLTVTEDELQALEYLVPAQLETFGFHPLDKAIKLLHNPLPDTSLESLESATHPALKRVLFDELLAQRLSLLFAKQARRQLTAPPLAVDAQSSSDFIRRLPFELTAAQQRVAAEISADLTQNTPMLRLLQGDVGSGKTVLAALAALQAIAQGFQVAMMAPTEILSEQHAAHLSAWFAPLNINVRKLRGAMKASERKEILTALAQHECQCVIGTHALFQKEVTFARLGLVIIDEQHRFGVNQRLSLHQKGQHESLVPHQLLMTATPIPRTLAMTHLAHLEVSVLDELPPGRNPVITVVLNQEKREDIFLRLNEALREGKQAYWICTLIEESENLQCQAALETSKILQEHLKQAKVGLVHGKMKPADKEAVMQAFKSGIINLLVATTVIEVGVDVPRASLMVIENAERLGLSQLHQLRGRVGRGSEQSYCLLLYQTPLSHFASERLTIMRSTHDGFIIAEKDLKLRGSGELLGTKQAGYKSFKLVDIQRDKELLPLVSGVAPELVRHQPHVAYSISQRWLGCFEHYIQG